MRLMLTNDDGVDSLGIYEMAKVLEKQHEVIIVAPDAQRSASGHSITINRPLIIREEKLEGLKSKAYSINGTPADCVRVGIDRIMDKKVDMVISGINRGFNIGNDVIYSGTVSAAMEGAMSKIPSVAVSTEITDEAEDYHAAAEIALKIIEKAVTNKINGDFILNINVPKASKREIKGIKLCKTGIRIYNDYFSETIIGDGMKQVEVQSGGIRDIDEEDDDTYLVKQGYVTLTPLQFNLTAFDAFKQISKIIE